MNNTLIRAFASFDSAQKARDELIAAGFERAQLELSVQQDEAGAMQGNFTVGDQAGGADAPVYERDYAPANVQVHCILTVAAQDADQLARASGIMARHGAFNPDPLTRANGASVINSSASQFG